MSNKLIITDTYRIELGDYEQGDERERARVAFLEAERRARLWCVPCLWSIVSDDGNVVIVRRRRPANPVQSNRKPRSNHAPR